MIQNSYFADAKNVLLDPGSFYRSMPKSGGIIAPLIFVVCSAVVAGVLAALGALFFSKGPGFFSALISTTLCSIWYLIVWILVGGSLMFFFWKRMGSLCSYETSLRVFAYASVLWPVGLVLHGWIGAIGLLITLLLLARLLIAASESTHGIEKGRVIWQILALAVLLFVLEQLGHKEHDKEMSAHGAIEPGEQAVQSNDVIAPENVDEDLQAGQETVEGDSGLPQSSVSVAEKVGESLGEMAQQMESLADGIGAELQSAGNDLVKGWDSALTGDEAGNEGDTNDDPAVARSDDDSSREVESTGLVEKTGESVGQVIEDLENLAGELGQGFQRGLASEEPGADVASEEAAASLEEGSTKGIASATGETLGNVVQSLGDIASDVGEGFERAMKGDDNDVSAADSEGGSSANVHAAKWSPNELGEAMARFVLDLDNAAERADEQDAELSATAAESLRQFLEAYERELDSLRQ